MSLRALSIWGVFFAIAFFHPNRISATPEDTYTLYAFGEDRDQSGATAIAFTNEKLSLYILHTNKSLKPPGEPVELTTAEWTVNGFKNGNQNVGTISIGSATLRSYSFIGKQDIDNAWTYFAPNGGAYAVYEAPEKDIDPVSITVTFTSADGQHHSLSTRLNVVHKKWQYRYEAAIGYKCIIPKMDASVSVHDVMETTFELKREPGEPNLCTSTVTNGPAVTPGDVSKNTGSCDPSVATTLSYGRHMEVSSFKCTFSGSENKLKFSIAMHQPDCPGYTNVIQGNVAVDMPVKESPSTHLEPEVPPKPYTEVISPKMNSAGMNLRTAWNLKELD